MLTQISCEPRGAIPREPPVALPALAAEILLSKAEIMTTTTAPRPSLDELKRVGIIAQNQKDLYLIRLRTVGGDLSADGLNAIGAVSRKYGRGEVHLTTRQAVEIPFVHADHIDAARTELEAHGIVLGVCGPRGRGIVACPGTAVCTSAIIETKELAGELDASYFRVNAPHKFKIGISGCPNNCSKPIENDIGVMGGVLPRWNSEACISCRLCVNICPVQAIEERDGAFVLDTKKCIYCGLCIRSCSSSAWTAQQTGYTLFLGGTLGKKPRLGTRAKVLIATKEELYGLVRRAFDWYVANGKKKERFGHTLDRIGLERSVAAILGPAEPELTLKEQTPAATNDPARSLDLRGICCPMNFVHAKLAIGKIKAGDILEVLLDEGEPITNVPRSLKDEGHTVLQVRPENGHFRVVVRKTA